MTEITWMDPLVPKLFNDPTFIPLDVKSVLDVGCGKGTLGALLRNFRPVEYLVGIDAYRPYLDHVREHRAYDLLLEWDFSSGRLAFDDNQFDLGLCLGTIEHLSKPGASTLLQELSRVSRRAIVTTPTYMQAQGCLEGNPYQAHQSRITMRDFRRAGYRVRGTGPVFIKRWMKPLAIDSWRIASLFPWLTATYIAVHDGGRA